MLRPKARRVVVSTFQNMRPPAGLLLSSVLLISGSVNAAPDDEKHDLTLHIGGTVTATVPEPEPPGLVLDDLIRLAVDDSFQVKVSQAQILEAQALYQTAVSLHFPQGQFRVVFGGPTAEAKTIERNRIETVTQSSLGGDLDFGELGITFRGNAELAVPLPFFGHIRNGKRAARRLVEAAEHQVTATRAQVVIDLTRAYWGWQLLQSLIESLDEGGERLEGVLDQIEELLDADSAQVTENDRLRLKFAVATLSVRRAQAEGGITQLSQAIRLLIGRGQGEALELRREKLEKAIPKSVPPLETLIARAGVERPELLALRKVVEAQKAFKDLRTSQLFPLPFVGGFLNFAVTTNATDQTNPFIHDPFNLVDAGAGVGLLFELDYFTKIAQIERAQAQIEVRSRQEVLAREATELEVRSLYAQIEAEQEQARRLERANLSARGWLTAATLAYDIGAGRADELIDAFLAWATSVAELENTRFDNIVHIAELARATGRLVQARSARERTHE